MKLPKLMLICMAFSLLIAASCAEDEHFPPEPQIQYLSMTKIPSALGVDDKGVLKIYFTDGDGDLGLADGDTFPPFDKSSPYYYNFFITYYEKQHGNYIAVDLPVTFNSRIPVVNPSGDNKAIKGEIEIELFINNPFSLFDTIMFEAYIADRALHNSNVIRTPDIIIRKK